MFLLSMHFISRTQLFKAKSLVKESRVERIKSFFYIFKKKRDGEICLHSFQQKCIVFWLQIEWTYYFSLTYGIVNFEQLSSGFSLSFLLCFFLCLLIFFFLKETLCNETVLVKIYIESNLKQKMAFLHL